jgi:glucose-6-phosphate dehydrogenase assembly protein OpcA
MTAPTNEIPLYQIKTELAQMWHEVTRSSVLTLVIYAPGADRAAQVSARLDSLVGQHPSRAIIVAVEPAGMRAEPAATVALHNHTLAQASNQVGDEQITIFLPDTALDRLSDYVAPLLLSDMPVFVWWAATPPANRGVIEDLVDLGDHQIFDSSAFADPIRDFGVLAGIIQRSRTTAVNYKAFHDFTWARLMPWRESLAQSFDPPYLNYLARVAHVRIGFASDPALPARPAPAYLMAGWLAASLGWTPAACQSQANGGLTATFTSPRHTGPVTVEIAPYTVPNVTLGTADDDQVPPSVLLQGSLLFTEVQANPTDGPPITIRTSRNGDIAKGTSVILQGDAPLEPPRLIAMEMPEARDLLAQQLTRFRYDHAYEDTVLAAHALLTTRTGG